MPIQPIKPAPLTKVKEKVDVSTVALILISAFSVGVILGLAALTVSWNYLQGGGFFRMATVEPYIDVENLGIEGGINIPLGGGQPRCPKEDEDADRTDICRDSSNPDSYNCCLSNISLGEREECESDGSCWGCDSDHVLCPDKQPGNQGQQVCCKVRYIPWLIFWHRWQGGCADSISLNNCVFSEGGSYNGAEPSGDSDSESDSDSEPSPDSE